MKEKWIPDRTQADFRGLAARFGLPPLVIKLIINRGVKEEEIERYLYGNLSDLADARLMKDARKAADMLKDAAKARERIAVVTDYDCDGIFSGMILYKGLKRIGADPVLFTPDRIKDGYGINTRIVDEIHEKGIRFLITCDNGISAKEETEYAKSLGMSVIITDHHEIPFEIADGAKNYILPPADAICNPKQPGCGYPFKGLCGAGVCYRLAGLLYEECGVPESETGILLQYAAAATVADVMELKGENRIIVKEGLKLLSKTDDPGLWAIKEASGINGREVTPYHIGFVIGPCFNAAGRLDTVKPAFDLLTCGDKGRALALAEKLRQLNDIRKDMTEEGTRLAEEAAESPEYKDKDVLVIPVKGCHESVIGIVAGRIREKYNKPTIIFTETEGGVCKGSGRSIPAYDMYGELTKCRELFIKYGGHKMAAGMSLKKEDLARLDEALNENSTLTEDDFIPVVDIDAEVYLRHLSIPVIESFSAVMPYGEGNSEPLFFGRKFNLKRAQVVGKNGNVLRITACDAEESRCDMVMFDSIGGFLGDIERIYGIEEKERLLRGAENDIRAAFTFNARINEYNGLRSVRLNIRNYKIIDREGAYW